MFRRLRPVLLLVLLLGCGSRTTVRGTVTYAGKELEQGFITFFPADGKGNTTGAPIEHGAYTVEGLAPGKKRVLISAQPQVAGRRDGAEGQPATLAPAAIARDAAGNNQVVEVAPGDQTLDFKLQGPR